jgi:hypothetical protein
VVWLQADPSLGEDPKKKAAMRRKKNLPTTLTPGWPHFLPCLSEEMRVSYKDMEAHVY